MIRRQSWLGLATTALCLGLLGCETHRSLLRPKGEDAKSDSSGAKKVESDTSKIPSVDSDSKDPQPFFKNNRKSGGWSSEAREIERDMGVY